MSTQHYGIYTHSFLFTVLYHFLLQIDYYWCLLNQLLQILSVDKASVHVAWCCEEVFVKRMETGGVWLPLPNPTAPRSLFSSSAPGRKNTRSNWRHCGGAQQPTLSAQRKDAMELPMEITHCQGGLGKKASANLLSEDC